MIMAIHWSLTIRDPRAKSMTSAVTNVIPDFRSWIVPGSASLYATNICNPHRHETPLLHLQVEWRSHTVLLIKAYNRASEKKPYLVSMGTSFLQYSQKSSSVIFSPLAPGDSGILT